MLCESKDSTQNLCDLSEEGIAGSGLFLIFVGNVGTVFIVFFFDGSAMKTNYFKFI